MKKYRRSLAGVSLAPGYGALQILPRTQRRGWRLGQLAFAAIFVAAAASGLLAMY